jgi:AcrR family transcriptional regulator
MISIISIIGSVVGRVNRLPARPQPAATLETVHEEAVGSRPVRRSYRGVSPQQRDADRRGRLVEAALVLYAEQRTMDIPVAVLCRAAGITTRQFYEIFRERDELFHAAYEHAAEIALERTRAAIAGAPDTPESILRAMLEPLFHAGRDSELGRAMAVLFVLGATSAPLRERRALTIGLAAAALTERLAVPPHKAGIFIVTVVAMLEMSFLDHALAPAGQSVEDLVELFSGYLSAG